MKILVQKKKDKHWLKFKQIVAVFRKYFCILKLLILWTKYILVGFFFQEIYIFQISLTHISFFFFFLITKVLGTFVCVYIYISTRYLKNKKTQPFYDFKHSHSGYFVIEIDLIFYLLNSVLCLPAYIIDKL